MPAPPVLCVLLGGRSSEHEVSVSSALSLLAAVDRTSLEVVPVGITRSGRWVCLPEDLGGLSTVPDDLPEVALVPGPALQPLAGGPRQHVDVVFPLLHGAFGEDGTVQGLLEMVGAPYVGSGVFASAACMDKVHMRALLGSAGLPLAPWARLDPHDVEVPRHLTYPVFVKPARGGSSLGVSRVAYSAQWLAALELARSFDPTVVVEAEVVGREIECGVLSSRSGGARASVPAEIRVAADSPFYDFEAKYRSTRTGLDVPADLAPEQVEQVQALAVRAFEVMGCAGLARVDFFLTPSGEVWVNEVNTMPGFTPTSMFPRMWAASGLAYPELVRELVDLALSAGTGLR